MMVQAFLLIFTTSCFIGQMVLAKPGDVFVLDSVGTKTAKLNKETDHPLILTVDLGDKSQYKPDSIRFNFTVGSYEFQVEAFKKLTDGALIKYRFEDKNGNDASSADFNKLEVLVNSLMLTGNGATQGLNGDKAEFGWDDRSVTLGLKGTIPKGFKLTATNAIQTSEDPSPSPTFPTSPTSPTSSSSAIPLSLGLFTFAFMLQFWV